MNLCEHEVRKKNEGMKAFNHFLVNLSNIRCQKTDYQIANLYHWGTHLLHPHTGQNTV